jgi:vancomycin resistance protein YoaR
MDKDGNDVGLRDLLGVGKSNFDGSSSSRIFNVEKGLGLFNNMILAPGDEFSFNEILGPVTLSNGWKAELAIFDGGYDTRPVAGGGLCQVSTTMYRAVVESGLSVVERRPHSYLVSYYVKDSDPRTGIDATIYPGSQDLRFVNNTSGYILIQTYTDGNDAYIKFYGTSDGRTVALDGPYKSGWYSPGPAKLTPTPDLAPGEVKITHAQHLGRTITWYQTITYPDNTEEKITINSNYKAIPAQGLIGSGGEPLASE